MRTALLLLLVTICLQGQAQDFTDEIGNEEKEETLEKVLIIPLKAQFLLSEIDNGLSMHSGKNVLEVREEIQSSIVMKLDDLYGKSSDYQLLNKKEDAGNLTYIRREFSYGYQPLVESPHLEDAEKGKKKNILTSLKLRKEEKDPKGYKTKVQNGQIVKEPIYKERYMAASVKTNGVLEFIVDEYQPSLILVITELDLMKNRDKIEVEDPAYIATMHYSLIDREGQTVGGSKIELFFDKSAFDINTLKKDVIDELCMTVYQNTMLYLNLTDHSQDIIDQQGEDDEY